MTSSDGTLIVGAGIGGLAAALRLSALGHSVTVLEAAPTVGGRMRTLPTSAGPADTGPTVLTMKPVFDALFAAAGERLEDHVTLTPLSTLARHYWDDGTRFDLFADEAETLDEAARVFGPRSADDLRAFSARARRLFDAFDGPMMQAARPSQSALTARVLRQPRLIADMAPWRSLRGLLRGAFREPKLAQLFGRYATYVGGVPQHSPALLSLIWSAEERGVWAVGGGMNHLARVIAGLAETRGTRFEFGQPVTRIERQGGRVTAVQTRTHRFAGSRILWAGDAGQLAALAPDALPARATTPKSLSADVAAFAATPRGPDLAYHTVLFGHDPDAEFTALAQGERPRDATLYLCAQDRATGTPTGPERFEIIRNAPPLSRANQKPEDPERCLTPMITRMADFGLTMDAPPGTAALTQPTDWARLFPGSQGAIYGRSPHGLTAGLKRPTARTGVPGLYLCGGTAHPGAGVPMATLSARHAVETIETDRTSTSPSRQTATPGGISTASATAAPARSRSSPS